MSKQRFSYLLAGLALAGWGDLAAGNELSGRELRDLRSIQYVEQNESGEVVPFPYAIVGPRGLRVWQDEERMVVHFWDPACGFSRQAHEEIRAWGQTLPAEWEYRGVPITGPHSYKTALVLASLRFHIRGREELLHIEPLYIDALFQLVQDEGADPNVAQTHRQALAQAGWQNWPAIEARLHSSGSTRTADEWFRIAARMQPDRVPQLVVGAQYRVHGDHVSSSTTEMLTVANGLVSLIMEQSEEQ